MKVILVMVSSANGKSTNGVDPNIYKWTSKEDSEFFFELLKKQNLIIMGSGTYEAAKDKITPTKGQLRIVLTSRPDHYEREYVRGQLEFRNESPKDLVRRLSAEGYTNALLVSGATTNKQFFEEGLVDELYLTIEPRIFGQGKPLIAEGKFEYKLKLISQKLLNEHGTLLLHYLILNS